jgi:hypothetical protein
MDDMRCHLDEQVGGDSYQGELVELSSPELERVGAGLCDPGILDIDK